MGIVAFFARRNVDHAFQVFDAQADHRHGVGFHHRQINHKIRIYNIGIEF